MSFWEELGQRITQGSQDALQKTKAIAGVMSMNADISDSKRKIRDLCEELGRTLVEDAFADLNAGRIRELLEADDADSLKREIDFKDWKEVLTKVMYIRSEEEVIAINEEKIREYKEEERCPSCGRKVSKNMAFCPDCGAKIEHMREEESGAEAAPKASEAASEAAAEAVEEKAPEAAAGPSEAVNEAPAADQAADVTEEAAE